MDKLFAVLLLAASFLVATALPEHLFFPRPEAEPTSGNHWGVLVAGSNSWYNYRHQADICHAYQILHENGVPDERIIVFMYDDIAYNSENPYQGQIFNKPNGPNVYPNVLKNYTGEDVTPENFLAVLTGDSSSITLKEKNSTGGVLASGPDDNVFVYFADHGGPDIIAFPSSELMAEDLQATLDKMHHARSFNKLVFFLEACESGSMFLKLPTNMKVFATTAAGPDESSWGTYCDTPTLPNNCLGDEYSVRWLEDADTDDLTTETLLAEFKLVKGEVVKSTPHKYGDMSFDTDTMVEYVGGNNQGKKKTVGWTDIQTKETTTNIASPEMKLALLQQRLMKTSNQPYERDFILQQIVNEAQTQRAMIRAVEMISVLVSPDSIQARRYMERPDTITIRNKSCYKSAVQYFSQNCFSLGQNEYALRLVFAFANMCDDGVQADEIVRAIDRAC